MIAIEINPGQLKRLRASVGKAKTKFGRELAAAVNQVAKKTKLDIGRGVRSVINIKKKEAETTLTIKAKE